jgi:CBS domain-containing protein
MGRLKLRVVANALLLLAAGVILIGAAWSISTGLSLQRGYQIEADKSSKQAAERGRVEMQDECLPLPSPAKEKCESEIGDTYRSYRHDTRDLAPQRTSATWTMFTGIAALIGAPVGIIGAWALVWTLFEQRRTTRAQLRAYVSAIVVTLNRNHPSREMLAEITIKNSGQTPAYNLFHAGSILALTDEKAERELTRTDERPKIGRPAPFTLHSGEECNGTMITDTEPTHEELVDVAQGKLSLYAFGTVYYEDAFEIPHESRFCYRAKGFEYPPPKPKPGETSRVTPMRWILAPFHNDSD